MISVAKTGLVASVISIPSSAESVERLLLFQTLAALVMFTAGSSVMVTMKSNATRRRERALGRGKGEGGGLGEGRGGEGGGSGDVGGGGGKGEGGG
eukprot:scaffold12222_cov73-Phaeocystis_antarctica.AAC.1